MTDTELIDLWIDSKKSEITKTDYQRSANAFLDFIGKPLVEIRLADLVLYKSTMSKYKPGTLRRMLSAIKGLLMFAYNQGVCPSSIKDEIKALRAPVLEERVVSKEQVMLMIEKCHNPRNKILIRLLYTAGVRASEIVGMTWEDVQPNESSGQIVVGCDAKRRIVRLKAQTWSELNALRKNATAQDPVFLSRKGSGSITRVQIYRIVRAAAIAAGIPIGISPSHLRIARKIS